jgi:hypothetical protein
MSNRDVNGRGFDPSSFDDVLELVRSWTTQRAMTASEIVEGLSQRGVLVRATSSGRHVIIESHRCCPGEPSEAKLFVVPTGGERATAQPPHQDGAAPPRQHRVIRPPGQWLHRVANLFGKRTRERILDPIIADMQLEYCEALAVDGPRRLRLWLVQARAWVAFAEAIVLGTVVGRLIKGISKLV